MKTARQLVRRLVETARFVALLAVGAVVGALALRSVGPPISPLASSARAVAIPGLPEYPGSKCAEFREDTFGEELVTEIEYVVASSLAEVRERYVDALARNGWTVTGPDCVYGEWVYNVTSGARRGVVELENRNGVTEIEVEIVEPAASRRGPAGGERAR